MRHTTTEPEQGESSSAMPPFDDAEEADTEGQKGTKKKTRVRFSDGPDGVMRVVGKGRSGARSTNANTVAQLNDWSTSQALAMRQQHRAVTAVPSQRVSGKREPDMTHAEELIVAMASCIIGGKIYSKYVVEREDGHALLSEYKCGGHVTKNLLTDRVL